MVLPHDASLAKALARAAGGTLEELGLVAPAPPVAPPPPKSPVPLARRVDSVVCAAADALDAAPRAVRPAVLAAFRAAIESDLAMRDVVDALAEPESTASRRAR